MVSYLRFLQASPNAPALDVYVNNVIAIRNYKYKVFTEYIKGNPGVYNIKLYTAGTKNLILERNIELLPNMVYTLAIIGVFNFNGMDLKLIDDHKRNADPNFAYMRFINLSPSIYNMDIVMNDELVVSELSYAIDSEYIGFRPGKYKFIAYVSNLDKVVLVDPNIKLEANKFYAGYIVGFEEVSPTLQILIPLEGITYLDFK